MRVFFDFIIAMICIYAIAYIGLNILLGILIGVTFPLRKDINTIVCNNLTDFIHYCKKEFTTEIYIAFALSFIVAYIVTKIRFFIKRMRGE
jgi:hypothetical protein